MTHTHLYVRDFITPNFGGIQSIAGFQSIARGSVRRLTPSHAKRLIAGREIIYIRAGIIIRMFLNSHPTPSRTYKFSCQDASRHDVLITVTIDERRAYISCRDDVYVVEMTGAGGAGGESGEGGDAGGDLIISRNADVVEVHSKDNYLPGWRISIHRDGTIIMPGIICQEYNLYII